MPGLRVLITNNALVARAGSELFTRDLAVGLLAAGHSPVAYSAECGEVAREIRARGIPVLSNFDSLAEQPHVVHGQHHIETMTAMLRFPGVPAIFVCHGWIPWEEAAPRFPRIRRYVAVSHLCRERMVCEHGIPAKQISVIPNFVDLQRFRRRLPLPAVPRNALLLSNRYRPDSLAVALLRDGCARAHVQLDMVGQQFGNATATPEALLPRYDLVFATGRCAHEALATGCAVIVCCANRVGPMVSTRNMDCLRRENFGLRAADEAMDAEGLERIIAGYDPADAAEVCERLRESADRDTSIQQYVNLYRDVIAEHEANQVDKEREAQAAAAYVAELGNRAKKGPALAPAATQERLLEATAEQAATQARFLEARAALAVTQEQLLGATAALADIQRSRSFRLAQRLATLAHGRSMGRALRRRAA